MSNNKVLLICLLLRAGSPKKEPWGLFNQAFTGRIGLPFLSPNRAKAPKQELFNNCTLRLRENDITLAISSSVALICGSSFGRNNDVKSYHFVNVPDAQYLAS